MTSKIGSPSSKAPPVFLLALVSIGTAVANDKLINLPANSWWEVPNTKMRGVCASPPPGGDGYNCKYVTSAWSGGVYDAGNRKMIIWGGGHGNYLGNEVYAFDTETLAWQPLTNPSTGTIMDRDPLPDGQPVGRHTYDGLAYVAHRGRILAYGGSRSGDGYGTSVTWAFDAATRKWEDRNPSTARPGGSECCEFTSAYDPVSRKVFLKDPDAIWAYDYDQNGWSRVKDWSMRGNPRTSVVDPKRRFLFTLGSGELLAYDIAGNKDVTSAWATTGGSQVLGGYGPALGYDPTADKLVAWNGGGPYVMDMATKAWTRMSGTGAPAAGGEWGTYGRMRYLPADNAWILVNQIDQNVFFFKLTADPGKPVSLGQRPDRAFKPSPDPRERPVPGIITLDVRGSRYSDKSRLGSGIRYLLPRGRQ